MARIIIIRSNSVNPDPRVEKEARTLSEGGYIVSVLAWDREGNCLTNEIKEKYEITRFFLKAPYGKIQLLPYIFIWQIYIFVWLLKHRWELVHACDLDTFIPSLIAAKLKRRKVIYDIFDFYAQMLPLQTPTSLRNLISGFDHLFIRLADAVIVVNEKMNNEIKIYNKNIAIIMNIPQSCILGADESADQRGKIFIIFYAGILSKTRGFNQIISAIREIEDIKLVIAGFGEDEEEIRQLISEEKSDIEFIGKISYSEVISRTRRANLLFALYDPQVPNHKYASPNKLFEAMMCGKPIIVSDGTLMAEIAEEEHCGYVVNYGDVESLKTIIHALKDNPKLCYQLGENGQSAYAKKYNWPMMKLRLLSLYMNLGMKK